MHISTNIKYDSNKQNQELILDKFFQFIMLDEIINGKCRITIFTAISFHSEYNDERLVISFDCNLKTLAKGQIKHHDKSKFYEEEVVLKQFWGQNSKVDSDLSSMISKCLEDERERTNKDEDADKLKSDLPNNSSCMLYIEEAKNNISKIIIQPTELKGQTNKVTLTGCYEKLTPELKKYVSSGYWFKSEFEGDIDSNKLGFKIKSDIKLTNAKFKSPDFKVYFQTPKKFDLKTSSADVEITNTADGSSDINNAKCEIVKVFSQSKIKYFDEWAELGIYVSSLFKIQMNNQLEKKIFSNGVSSLTFTAQMEDLESPRKREIHLLILSIIFSLFCSIGLDVTRQGTPEFIKIFPTLIKSHATFDFLWLIVCLGVLVKYLFVTTSKINIKVRRFIIPAPVVTWLSIYVLAIPVPDLALHSVYYADIVISLYCLLSFLYIINFRPPMPIATNNVGRFHKILRSITGT
ncbi:hypothetical protein [Aeromonas caviae]|uniref:hypothetical protein n=1 Tax=Aeromonas caviae TaxID=648 RepID=UPI00191E9381|nr:hypothetical protein [Aeromonas caviae]MBL0516218.1 hypothetical protein [Aeromonas caviae]MDY7784245.1 hypothetical protein [Aeromonas caviae]